MKYGNESFIGREFGIQLKITPELYDYLCKVIPPPVTGLSIRGYLTKSLSTLLNKGIHSMEGTSPLNEVNCNTK